LLLETKKAIDILSPEKENSEYNSSNCSSLKGFKNSSSKLSNINQTRDKLTRKKKSIVQIRSVDK
jgi:hypothetical protein